MRSINRMYGFSDGGIIALILAIKRPDIPCRLMVSGVNVEPEGIDDRYFRSIRVSHFLTRSKKKKLMLDQPHISAEELSKIKVPTVLLAGEHVGTAFIIIIPYMPADLVPRKDFFLVAYHILQNGKFFG